jgi:hypothetical protein
MSVPKSRYLERFNRLNQAQTKLLELSGDYLLCEVIKPDEFAKKVTREDGTESKIIFASSQKAQLNTIIGDAPMWLRILMCGEGYFDSHTDAESGATIEETVPLKYMPGDIILVSSISVRKLTVFGHLENYESDSIALTKASEIQGWFRGDEGYTEAFGLLNSSPQESLV